MKKLMRRIAALGVSAAVAGGALLAAGGSATAASAHTTGHVPARITAVHTGQGCRTAPKAPDAWVAGQLQMFEPAAAKRLAVYDPWVKDQLTLFVCSAR